MKYKRAFLVIIAVISILIIFSACDKDNGSTDTETVYYTVTFDPKNGEAIKTSQVASGANISEPATPKKDGYMFGGWMNLQTEWNFAENTVLGDISLTAKWYSATDILDYNVLNDTDAVITKLKQNIRDVIIPDMINGFNVVAIGDEVFADLKNNDIYSITLPESVSSIGEGAFRDCDGITITFLGEGKLTSIGEGAFYNCSGLTSVSLGEGILSIPYEAFYGCSSLTTVTIPSGVSVLEDDAFHNCSGLTSITMPSSISSIENGVFDGCSSLRSVFFLGNIEQIDDIIESKTQDMNDPFLNSRIYIYSETAPENREDEIKYWYRDENGKIKLW